MELPYQISLITSSCRQRNPRRKIWPLRAMAGNCLYNLTLGALICAACIAEDSPRKGHLKPLGSHRPGQGVTVIGKFSSPRVFYNEFVSKKQPIWMRGALDSVNHFGLQNWTDDYLRENYGTELVDVEIAKLEDRKKGMKQLTVGQFLDVYKSEDLYLVHSLSDKLADLALVPPSLACGGFQHHMQDVVLWMGSGKAQSVLHNDEVDNLICLFDGRKDLVLIDPLYKDAVESTGFVAKGGYSLVDVEKVDFDKFPKLADVNWKSVRMRAGDCLFIPQGWYHQVTSSTERHLALNFWFTHLYWFNVTDCTNSTPNKMWPISDHGIASTNEYFRAKLLGKIHDKGMMFKYTFLSSLDSSTEARREMFFNAVDKYKDSVLSWSELYNFDIDMAVLYFPDIFDLPGGTDSVPHDLVLYDGQPQTFSSEGYSHEEDEEEDEEDEERENAASEINENKKINVDAARTDNLRQKNKRDEL